MDKEILLEELQSVKHCIEMTKQNISDPTTAERILAILGDRISKLESDVDAKIASEEFGGDMSMDVS